MLAPWTAAPIAQTADGVVALTAVSQQNAASDRRRTRPAAGEMITAPAPSPSRTTRRDQGSPRHRVAFLTTKGLVDTVECGPSVAPSSPRRGRGVPRGRRRARRALRRRRAARRPAGPRRRRVVEEAACVSTAAAGGTALAVVGDRFRWARRTGAAPSSRRGSAPSSARRRSSEAGDLDLRTREK